MANSKEIIAFFRGTGTDIECRSLEQILGWDDQLMECCHDYVQWLFPTDTPSRFNSDAPLIDKSIGEVIAKDSVMKDNFLKGFHRFLKFLGLSVAAGPEELQIEKAANFEKRKLMCWTGPQNHNWRRLTRVLRCLDLMSLKKEQRALYSCLEMINAEFPGLIDEDTIQIWQTEVGLVLSPGQAKVVLESPNLFASLCSRYFKQYDANGNDTLELSEALVLAHDMYEGLGVSPDLIEESKLAASMRRSQDAVILSADEFPTWFAAELQDLLEKAKMLKDAAVENHHESIRRAMTRSRSSSWDDVELGSVMAVLDSPEVFSRLCESNFKKYDANGNGKLELAECMVLARDLHETLGLPMETMDEWLLLSTKNGYADEQGAIPENAFQDWFATALRSSLAQGAREQASKQGQKG
eukprot:TRINITY_DN64316_c0_g1_i1.p1 TRINITY_DN64316_c0_g1~~TRINITY_DN64316_c0_g1_i1.p1  ORF type:complete len:411 (+),score=87.58 TRINITY_DN64316_c0_g1_i1:38-1270(+)